MVAGLPIALAAWVKVREVFDRLKADGWYHVRTAGSHRHFQHEHKIGTVTLAGHDGDDVPLGTLRAIFRQAGLDWRLR